MGDIGTAHGRSTTRAIRGWHEDTLTAVGILASVRHAEEVPSTEATALLRDALELVTGSPSQATTGYSWTYSQGLATEMIEVIKQAPRRPASLYLDAGDPKYRPANEGEGIDIIYVTIRRCLRLHAGRNPSGQWPSPTRNDG